MYSFLQPILNKGGAGRSMTREESIEALNPVVLHYEKLLLRYDATLRSLNDRDLAAQINEQMNRARTELAKLKSTVFALGGTPPNGVDLPTDVRVGSTDAEIIHGLDDAERAYRDALDDAIALPHHQIRSTAILKNNLTGSDARIELLHPIVTRMPKRDRQPAVNIPEDLDTDVPVDLAPDEHHAGPQEQPAIDVPPRR